jgi:anti-sigma regulatory factor (Ser/Thr protein kinase)
VRYTQRIPSLTELVRRAPGTEVLQVLRRIELECQTRAQADEVADEIAALLPDPMKSRLGLIELLLNAIEHGNLEVGGEHKCALLRAHRFDEEIAARTASERYSARRVRVIVSITYPLLEIEIRDDGNGFDWRTVLAADGGALDRPNGRGLAIVSRTCFPGLEYRDPGNVAIVRVAWPR